MGWLYNTIMEKECQYFNDRIFMHGHNSTFSWSSLDCCTKKKLISNQNFLFAINWILIHMLRFIKSSNSRARRRGLKCITARNPPPPKTSILLQYTHSPMFEVQKNTSWCVRNTHKKIPSSIVGYQHMEFICGSSGMTLYLRFGDPVGFHLPHRL